MKEGLSVQWLDGVCFSGLKVGGSPVADGGVSFGLSEF